MWMYNRIKKDDWIEEKYLENDAKGGRIDGNLFSNFRGYFYIKDVSII